MQNACWGHSKVASFFFFFFWQEKSASSDFSFAQFFLLGFANGDNKSFTFPCANYLFSYIVEISLNNVFLWFFDAIGLLP